MTPSILHLWHKKINAARPRYVIAMQCIVSKRYLSAIRGRPLIPHGRKELLPAGALSEYSFGQKPETITMHQDESYHQCNPMVVYFVSSQRKTLVMLF